MRARSPADDEERVNTSACKFFQMHHHDKAELGICAIEREVRQPEDRTQHDREGITVRDIGKGEDAIRSLRPATPFELSVGPQPHPHPHPARNLRGGQTALLSYATQGLGEDSVFISDLKGLMLHARNLITRGTLLANSFHGDR